MHTDRLPSVDSASAPEFVAPRVVQDELLRVTQSDAFENTVVTTAGEAAVEARVNRNNWFLPWNFHWTFNHPAELFPHQAVPNQIGGVRPLVQGAPVDLQDVTYCDGARCTKTLESLVQSKQTDGFLVLHKGKVVHMSTRDDVAPTQDHWALSLSRTFTALVAGKLEEQGLLDMDKPVETVIPELADTGYNGCTLRLLLDMRSGVSSTNILAIMWAHGFFPNGPLPAPKGIRAHILGRHGQQKPHGGAFKYRCLDTAVIGWLCEVASGRRLPDLISEMVWQPMGAEKPAQFLLDGSGTPTYDCGLCASLHDLGRFGLALAEDGKPNSRQILPRGWMADTRQGDAGTRAAFGGKFFAVNVPGGMYRNHMWVLDPKRGITLCYGAFGQMVYVDPRHDMVCVLLSSWVRAQDPVTADWLKAFDALGAKLGT